MKKLFISFALVFLCMCGLVGCAASYDSNSMKSGLERRGYTVQVNATITGLDTSKMEGYKSNLYAYKEVDGEERGILILIFDSTDHANKEGSTSGSTASETMILMHDWGRKHAPDSDSAVYGTANNIIWAGCQDAKNAAGIE